MITKEDIKDVAKSINVELTDSELQWALLCYEDAQRQDPTGTWNLVVEDLIHQCVEMREDKQKYDSEIYGEDASTDDCFFDVEDPVILNIKITGGGTREDISKALALISKSILETPIEDLDGSEWEDCTLMTEINAEDETETCEGCGEEIPAGSLYCPNCGDENF